MRDDAKNLYAATLARLHGAYALLFLFEGEQPRASSFWMFRTRIPLSIAFLDSASVIREIREMRPCRSPLSFFCPSYPSSVPFHAALESIDIVVSKPSSRRSP